VRAWLCIGAKLRANSTSCAVGNKASHRRGGWPPVRPPASACAWGRPQALSARSSTSFPLPRGAHQHGRRALGETVGGVATGDDLHRKTETEGATVGSRSFPARESHRTASRHRLWGERCQIGNSRSIAPCRRSPAAGLLRLAQRGLSMPKQYPITCAVRPITCAVRSNQDPITWQWHRSAHPGGY